MAYGLRLWDAASNLVLDTSDRVGRVLGFLYVTDDGSMNVPDFALGDPFAKAMGTAFIHDPISGQDITFAPYADISGTTLSWFYPATKAPALIVYGVK